jgi:cell division protein FtsZ
MSIKLQLPKLTDLRPRINVIGVGGAGCNAINNMISAGLNGVDFVVANTDAQALATSSAEHRLQLGVNLTEGLGAGSKPEIGEAAAEEAINEIRAQIAGSHMVFIAAGMGGGTGTGAAAVIARIAKEMGILVVGIVTKPFHFEGARRMRIAEAGIAEIRKHVDTLIVIPNQNLFRVANEKTTFAAAFAMADQVLYSGVASITELMTKEGLINLDFADVRAIMSEMGKAMMGTGEASGEKRAIEAAEAAISNPLLDDVSMRGARGLLISITGGPDLTLYEVDEAATRIREEVDSEANIILGATFDDSLEGTMRVSVVATGLAIEQSEHLNDDEVVEEAAPARPVFGYTGKQPIPVKRPIQPAPMAVASQVKRVAPQPAPQPVQQHEEVVEEEPEEMKVTQQVIHQARAQTASPRMPQAEDFPPIAQRQIAAQQNRIENIAEHAAKKKKGLFERLAGVGLSRKGDLPAQAEAEARRQEPRIQTPEPQRPQVAQMPVSGPAQPAYDDDQLEIPAFLRRQAN